VEMLSKLGRTYRKCARKVFGKSTLLEFETNGCNRWALLSYICLPFLVSREEYFLHTNYDEAKEWLASLQSLGYNVIVCNYSDQIDVDRLGREFSLVAGFGKTFNYLHERRSGIDRFIYYGTGHGAASVREKSMKLLSIIGKTTTLSDGNIIQGLRIVPREIEESEHRSDVIIALGNRVVADSYGHHSGKRIYSIEAFYLSLGTSDSYKWEGRQSSSTDILWFGSHGMYHKGLHNFRRILREFPNIKLHVCGDLRKSEREMVSRYYGMYLSRVILHGSINPYSCAAKDIYSQCMAVVLPSASEGGSPGLLSVVMASGLYPIYTSDCGVSLPEGIMMDWKEDMEDTLYEAVKSVMSYASCQGNSDVNREFIRSNMNLSLYSSRLRKLLRDATA